MQQQDTNFVGNKEEIERHRNLVQIQLLKKAAPLMGPKFDPERDIEEFSDDSSDEDEDD